jgi:hypothetical protein
VQRKLHQLDLLDEVAVAIRPTRQIGGTLSE